MLSPVFFVIIILNRIYLYLVGIRVDSWPLCSSGLLYDRAWALVDPQGRAITQKVFAKLALVQPSINLQEGVMLVRAPGMADVLVISLQENSELTPCAGKLLITSTFFTSVCAYCLRDFFVCV